MRRAVFIALCCVLAAACGSETREPSADEAAIGVVVKSADAERGKKLFIDKGCVICHSVNGIGGKAAPALDAQIGEPEVDPVDFAARMWAGAPAMIELQSIELGYTISLTGDEISDLAAFSGDRHSQKLLALKNVPQELQDAFLDEQFWEVEDWNEFLESGQEEAPEESGDRQ